MSLYQDFYPRSPCGERRLPRRAPPARLTFLSTFPLRGTSALWDILFFPILISIHVPLAGNVFYVWTGYVYRVIFLSTFPLRGTSHGVFCVFDRRHISIHVPLAGNVGHHPQAEYIALIISIHVPLAGNVRPPRCIELEPVPHFYPRSPCGERRTVAQPPGAA